MEVDGFASVVDPARLCRVGCGRVRGCLVEASFGVPARVPLVGDSHWVVSSHLLGGEPVSRGKGGFFPTAGRASSVSSCLFFLLLLSALAAT